VVAFAQLIAIGFSASQINSWITSGRLHRVHHGVYSIAPPELLTRKGRYMAAVLACGRGAVLSHRSAADLHELRATDRSKIEVIVASEYKRLVRGVEVHRSRTLAAHDITTVDHIPCTTVARTLLDLAGVVGRRPLERAIEQAEVQEVLDGADLDRQLGRNRHTRAASRLRAVLADHDDTSAPTESEFEERFLAFCKNARLSLPERQVYINLDDGEPPVRGDFVWRAQKLIVETDGNRYHRTRAAFESDRRKDQRLTLAGWRVLRITWRQLKAEPERIAKMIRRALGLG
jgi:predicted transcriptional regulator of viral defense system